MYHMNNTTYKKHLTIWIIATIVIAGISFYAGNKHGQAATPSRGQFGQQAGTRTGGRFGSGAGLVAGTVLSKDDTSMTIKMRDGSSKIVLYSGSTQVLRSAPGTAADVAVGAQVSAQGQQNSDGSVTAQSIQIRPDMPVKAPTGATQ